MCIALQVECPSFLSEFNETLHFLDRFLKNTHLSNFTKILPVGATLFHADKKKQKTGRTDGRADRQTDMMKLSAAFGDFAKAP